MSKRVLCGYCGSVAEFLKDSSSIYRGKNYGPVYVCHPCEARVGCHDGTENPLGTLANHRTRALRMQAHAAFDPLWMREVTSGVSKGKARRASYAWLAEMMGEDAVHISQMDEDDCLRVIGICRDAKIKS